MATILVDALVTVTELAEFLHKQSEKDGAPGLTWGQARELAEVMITAAQGSNVR
jgi:hypothetical protein